MANNAKGLVGRCSFVALGSFNPAILHPHWFSHHSILPAEEIESLLGEPFKKEIPEIGVTIEYGPRFLVEPTRALINFRSFLLKATRSKFEIWCEKKENFSLFLDVIKKIFLILPETPVTAYGLNFNEHIEFDQQVPAIVDKFFAKTELTMELFGNESSFGHTIFTEKGKRKVTFRIEPSERLASGVSLSINSHYENETADNKFITSEINKNFNDDLDFMENIILKCGKVIR